MQNTTDLKIFITGNAGAGKTSVAKQLGEKLQITPLSLDGIVWQSGWKLTSELERIAGINHITKTKKIWIIDGVSKYVMDMANVIIFLDIKRSTCYLRLIKRNWKYLLKSRPELPPKCPEILIVKRLISIVWNFDKLVKPNIIKHITENKESKLIYHITTPVEIDLLFQDLDVRLAKINFSSDILL